ncbi:hypothetical protein [Paraburkholderia sp. BCC1886]|uniref:hypothetical protein n=1 Tax=Paraburkholderia sp. BCC1886 TaxID=2562670 RepID=UPI001182E0AA|nr:hypothetical protein [Paraburkholderia sp. BCC1886]
MPDVTAYSKRVRAPWEDEAIDTSRLPSGWTDVLICLIERGPVDDGDIPSKSARNALLEAGFAAKVIIDQKEAGNVATYYGRALYCQLVDEDNLEAAIAKRQASKL